MAFDDLRLSSIPFQPYVVAFFDLLGHGDALEGIRELPTDDAGVEEFRRCVKRTIGAIRGVRTLVRSCYETFRDAELRPPPGLTLPESVLDEIRSYRQIDLQFQGFGDTVIVFFPTHDEQRGFQTVSLQWLLSTIGLLMHSLLSVGCPVRGAIEVGTGVEVFEREIHGPVLADVYRMESKEAEYPRILIGSELLCFLRETVALNGIDVRTLICKHSAAECLSLIVEDEDGRSVLNYLAPAMRNLHLEGPGKFDEFVKGAYSFALEEGERFRSEGNDVLCDRYDRLRRFIECNCGQLF